MKEYKVTGNISHIECGHFQSFIRIEDLSNEEQAPVLLEAIGNIQTYIDELTSTDYEEKYMRKIFTYGHMCVIEKIEVLDSKGKIVKTITPGTRKDEFSKWID